MKRPKTLIVYPFTFSLEMRDGWARDTGNLGNCIADDHRIIMEPSQDEQAERDTALHESLHAMWAQTTLNKNYTEEQQEEIVWTLTPRLLGFLRDNPQFLQWLVLGK